MTKGGQLLKLFTDEGIAGSLPFAEVRRQAFAMLDAARLDALAEYLATKARFDEKAFEWQHLDKAAQRIKLNLRPILQGVQSPRRPRMTRSRRPNFVTRYRTAAASEVRMSCRRTS